MGILEHEDDWPPFGDFAEEHPPGRKQLGAIGGHIPDQAEQRFETGLDPGPVVRVGHELGDCGPEPGTGDVIVGPFENPAALAHHLGHGPEAELFPVGG